MPPKAYFERMVLPTYEEFLADNTNVRRAMLACMATHHLMDAIGMEASRKATDVYKELETQCPALNTVKAVCLVAKHIVPTQSGFKKYTIDHVKRGRGAAFSDGTYFNDGTTFADSPETIVLSPSQTDISDVSKALDAAVDYFRGKLDL